MAAGRRGWAGWLRGASLLLVMLAVVSGAPYPGGAQVRRPLVQGQPPPDFALPDPSGRQVRLSDFKGRVILLSFWSCYTDTCFASLGAFTALIDSLGPLGLAAPTVCQEIPPALAADRYAGLLKRCSAGQTILIDEDQRIGARYFVTEYPTTVLIGADFTVRDLLQGVAPLRDPAFHAKLEEMVRAAGAPRPDP